MKLTHSKIFLIFMFFWVVPYSTATFFVESRTAYLLPFWIDNHIPLWPPALIVYALYMPFVFFTFILVKDLEVLKKGLYAFIIAAVVTFCFFVIVPTAMPRPEISANGFFDAALLKVWFIDTPKNAFPSQHVAFPFVCSFIWATAYKKWGWTTILFAVAVAISTMLVKQHYIWDVIGGIVVAVFAYWWAFLRGKKVAVASKALES
jgi:membrane-associated phospholipid phosphatase